jgi:hypothetical protein
MGSPRPNCRGPASNSPDLGLDGHRLKNLEENLSPAISSLLLLASVARYEGFTRECLQCSSSIQLWRPQWSKIRHRHQVWCHWALFIRESTPEDEVLSYNGVPELRWPNWTEVAILLRLNSPCLYLSAHPRPVPIWWVTRLYDSTKIRLLSSR